MCIISDLLTLCTDRNTVSSAAVTFAAKGYFDALVRMGELASESQGSKDLGKSGNTQPDEAQDGVKYAA